MGHYEDIAEHHEEEHYLSILPALLAPLAEVVDTTVGKTITITRAEAEAILNGAWWDGTMEYHGECSRAAHGGCTGPLSRTGHCRTCGAKGKLK